MADGRTEKPTIGYDQGLEVARRINALRYLDHSAMRNCGLNEVKVAASVVLRVKKDKEESMCAAYRDVRDEREVH